MEPDSNVTPTESFLPHPRLTRLQISAIDTVSEQVETFNWDMLDDDKEEAWDLPVMLMELEIIGLSRKKRKSLEKKEKSENFGGEVGFRVYNLEEMEEDGEEDDGEEWQICMKEIL